MSVRPSVHNVLVLDANGLTSCHSFLVTRVRSIKWCHFQCSRTNPSPVFTVTSFLSSVSILTRDIDIANLSRLSVCLSVRLSVRNVPVSDENGLTYRHSFFSPYGSPIILVLPASNILTKFRRGHPLRGR